MASDKIDARKPHILWRYAPLILVAAFLVTAYALGWHRYFTLSNLADSRAALKAYVMAHPVLAPAAFVSLYTLAAATAFPAASLLTVAGGFLFGWLLGGTLVLVGATAGATLLFLAARTAFRDTLRRLAGGKLARLAKGFEDGAFGYLLLLRLVPIFPFWLVNIAPAFFEVRTKTYLAATALGIMPGTFAYAYLGRGLESVIVAAANSGREATLSDLATRELTVALLAVAIVAAIPLIVRKLRAKRLP